MPNNTAASADLKARTARILRHSRLEGERLFGAGAFANDPSIEPTMATAAATARQTSQSAATTVINQPANQASGRTAKASRKVQENQQQ